MVVPVNPVGIAPATMKPMEPQAFYVVTYQLGASSFLEPAPSDWPLTPAPPRLDQTWTWRQVHMLGQDIVPGKQIFDLPQRGPQRLPYYGTEWRQVGMLGRDIVPGEQSYDLTPRAPSRLPYYGTEWRQVGMLGQDRLPVGDQAYDRQVLPTRGAGQTWVLNLLETTLGLRLPFNQYDWPLPRAPARIEQTTTWRQVGMLGQDQLPVGDQVYDLPNRGIRLAIYDWIQAVNLALLYPPAVGPLGVVANQYDWPLPRAPLQPTLTWSWRQVGMLGRDSLPKNQFYWPLPDRGPAQPDRSFTFRSQFIPPAPPPFVGAQYFLLQPHYVNNFWLAAWTTVTEGHEVPVGWIPTLMVDPLNDQAVSAFYAAGPRRGYPGPGYDWQGFNYFTARRTAAIQSPVTHWKEVSPGMYALTGLGSNRPPVGG